tara:strand:+ start:4566 stop:6158 length:1593 start_codon:yes stop_codon:yes gene_type:complete
MIKEEYDVVIVGSGFGGSVSALRLAEKGYKVLVVEKGRRYNSLDFAKTNWNLRKYFWMPKLFLYGIQCISFLKDVFILHGVGVGGGSLVYANTLLKPPKEAFLSSNWPDKNWFKKLEPFYECAKKMLGATKAKKFAETDKILNDVAKNMGKESTFSKVNVGVYFGKRGVEEKDPYFGGDGPPRSGCIYCGGCMIGCRYNAKNTLDKNYLFLAEKRGAKILSEYEVLDIKNNNQGYKLSIKKTTGIKKQSYVLKASKVVLSGGVMGTVKLLLKCKAKKYLPNISKSLGNYVRTNSESIIAVKSNKLSKSNYTDGLAISAGFHPNKDTYIETVRFGKGQNALGLLATFMPNRKKVFNSLIITWLFRIIRYPNKFIKNIFPYKWSEKTLILLVMQPIDNFLKLNYKRRWWRIGGYSMNSNSKTGKKIPSFIPVGEEVAKKISNINKGDQLTTYMDALFGIPTTAHILGGACIGKNEESGVVNERFEVYNYPNLYVIDGSVIPSNLGVNPSLTITAMAEYAMSLLPEKNKIYDN